MCLRLHEAVGKWAYAPLCMFETSKWPYCFQSYSLFTSFKINQSFNEIPFPSIQFILTAYTKLPGSEGLDLIHLPQSTQFLKNKHNFMTWETSNSRNPMGIQCNDIGISCDTQGMTCSAYVWLPKIGCLACASLIPHMHGTDLHPGNWKGFQQRRSAFGM